MTAAGGQCCRRGWEHTAWGVTRHLCTQHQVKADKIGGKVEDLAIAAETLNEAISDRHTKDAVELATTLKECALDAIAALDAGGWTRAVYPGEAPEAGR